jgi:hypothetical protein
MTTQEALNVIDAALAQIMTNREGHLKIQEAIDQIQKATKDKSKK